MNLIAGVWTINVYADQYTESGLTLKLGRLAEALTDMEGVIATRNVVTGSVLRGIFVGPEYLVAAQRGNSPGMKRAVEENAKETALNHFRRLSREHPRILIIPGSIAWRKAINRAEVLHDLAYQLNSHAPDYQHQAAFGKATHIDTAQPTYMMRNSCYALLNGKVEFMYNKQGDFNEVNGANADTVFIPGGQKGFVNIEGIKFGLEICLDHNIGMLSEQARATQIPDVHVICSALVLNDLRHVRVQDGGYFVHASIRDSYNDGGGLEPVSGVWRYTVGQFQDVHEFDRRPIGGGAVRYYDLNIATMDEDLGAGLNLMFNSVEYDEWMAKTHRNMLHFRSNDLTAVDRALNDYQAARDNHSLSTLRVAFRIWYQSNPKERTERNVDDCVERLKTSLSL